MLYRPILPECGDEDSEAIANAGGMPDLHELRLHQGSIWLWNRPVYDPAAGGHLRIELRALPAGPSIVDMLANAAMAIYCVTPGIETKDAFSIAKESLVSKKALASFKKLINN